MNSVLGDPERDLLRPLSRTAVREFAALLRYEPSSPNNTNTASLPQDWLDAQKFAVENALCKELRARFAQPVRNLLRYPFTDHFPPLCPAHRKLDSELVGNVFRLLRVEVSARVDTARAYLRWLRREGRQDECPPTLREFVERMSGVVTLYVSEETFEYYFGKGAARPRFRFQRVESGCPACVMAVVGGRPELLVALRANMEARAKRRYPRLLRLVDAWIEQAGDVETVRAMKADNERLREEIREMRRVMRDRRREKHRDLEMEAERDKDGSRRGRKDWREGIPDDMAHVKVKEWADHPEQQQQQHDGDGSRGPYSTGTMDCSRDVGSSSPTLVAETVGKDTEPEEWEIFSSSVSSLSSHSDVDEHTDENGDFIPARKNWPRAEATGQPAPAPAPNTSSNTRRPQSMYSSAGHAAAAAAAPPSIRRSMSIYSGGGPSLGALSSQSSILSTAPRPGDYADIPRENIKIFLDSRQTLGQGRDQDRQSRQSTSTTWADLYRG
ncbi:hypothetical protein VTK56DRAFT_5162 [Thermocarpiscus australiensis]